MRTKRTRKHYPLLGKKNDFEKRPNPGRSGESCEGASRLQFLTKKSQIQIGKDDFVIPFGKATELAQYEGEMEITFPFAYYQGISARIFSGGIFSASIIVK